jgi:tRNA threonylcarbamoyladenosine biosynthesis protein TsaB
VILAIDTSSAMSALALLGDDGTVLREEIAPSGPAFGLAARVNAMRAERPLSKVAVATGPGSFTGLRVGVSFGLGLAMGFKIPIVPLPTLAVQAARSDEPVTAVAEAGRGRLYHLAPGGGPGLAEPSELPRGWPLAGWLRAETEATVVAAGLALKPAAELRTFGAAAARLLETAREVAYGSLKVEYMQSFSARKPRAT